MKSVSRETFAKANSDRSEAKMGCTSGERAGKGRRRQRHNTPEAILWTRVESGAGEAIVRSAASLAFSIKQEHPLDAAFQGVRDRFRRSEIW